MRSIQGPCDSVVQVIPIPTRQLMQFFSAPVNASGTLLDPIDIDASSGV